MYVIFVFLKNRVHLTLFTLLFQKIIIQVISIFNTPKKMKFYMDHSSKYMDQNARNYYTYLCFFFFSFLF